MGNALENIVDPQQRINAINGQINALSSKISACDAAYESLRQFKSMVSNSHEDFETVNSKKKQVLSNLKSFANNNMAAAKYEKGMATSLTGIGATVVGLAFGGLQLMIAAKQAEYAALATSYKTQVAGLKAAKGQAEAEKLAQDTVKDLLGV